MKTQARSINKPAPAPAKPASKAPAVVKKNTQVATPQSAALPAHMRGDEGRGTENVQQSDLEIPRLKLVQALSPELQTYDTLKAGHFFHTAAEHIFTEPVRVVPIYMDRRFILWNPREAGGGILARADDGVHWVPANKSFTVKLDKKDGGKQVTWKTADTVEASGLANWGTLNPDDPDSPPAATLMYSFIVAFPDHPDLMPAVLTFQRSSIRAGRRFLTKLKTTRAPMFGLQFVLSSVVEQNGANQDFYNMQLTGDGFVEDEAAYLAYKEQHEGFASTGFGIKDLEGAQDDEPPADEKPEAQPKAGGRRI